VTGTTYARGFQAAGVACGLKPSGKPDLAVVLSELPAAAAGVYTQNRLAAAPVRLARRHAADGQARAIVVNSGNANACTGPQGERDALTMAEQTAAALGLAVSEVLVASTGVIGVPLPMDKVAAGIAGAAVALSAEGGDDAARAILTTDRSTKLAHASLALQGTEVRIGAMAKGAGMIRPDMATTLTQVTTDAAVEPLLLRRLLRAGIAGSFNVISVDGTQSTNDCALVLANGASGVTIGEAELPTFGEALDAVLLDLAEQIVADGEGATRYARFAISGAADEAQAKRAARAVGEDVLVRCMLEGADPNWGRLVAALGGADVDLDPDLLAIWIGDVQLVTGGQGQPASEPAARQAMQVPRADIRIDLGLGQAAAHLYSSGLSSAYVEFNTEYTT
jgi:glutamate N-acetyltransferase / amino-acid N-acetyltransferase